MAKFAEEDTQLVTRRHAWMVLYTFTLCGFVWVWAYMPVMAIPEAAVDDALFVRGARSIVIAHPTRVIGSTGVLAASTRRTVSSTDAPLAFAVLTTERKAA